MTPTEALVLLDKLNFESEVPSRINLSFSRGQMHQIVRDAILSIQHNRPLDRIMEKRVHQCLRNQRNPRF